MTRMLRPFALLALCFALVAGSVSMAVARGHAAAVTRGGVTLVLCSGYGYRTVSLDARGNPVGPLHPCPDCLAGMVAYLAPTMLPWQRLALIPRRADVFSATVILPRRAAHLPRARGPPLAV
jgi:hypothetical protein